MFWGSIWVFICKFLFLGTMADLNTITSFSILKHNFWDVSAIPGHHAANFGSKIKSEIVFYVDNSIYRKYSSINWVIIVAFIKWYMYCVFFPWIYKQYIMFRILCKVTQGLFVYRRIYFGWWLQRDKSRQHHSREEWQQAGGSWAQIFPLPSWSGESKLEMAWVFILSESPSSKATLLKFPQQHYRLWTQGSNTWDYGVFFIQTTSSQETLTSPQM